MARIRIKCIDVEVLSGGEVLIYTSGAGGEEKLQAHQSLTGDLSFRPDRSDPLLLFPGERIIIECKARTD